MNKTMKLLSIIVMAVVVILASSSMVFANSPSSIAGQITPNMNGVEAGGLTTMAGKVLGLIQIASAVLAVILIAVFGFKFILGSANEKADYQKSFIPLIVGLVVVFSATSVAKLLFGLMSDTEDASQTSKNETSITRMA